MNVHYLAFEGIDGAGKHEQIDLFGRHLIKCGVTPIHLLEPSHGPHGREIRRRLRGGDIGTLAEQRELFTLDRRDHVEAKIKPLLKLARSQPGFMILQSRTYLSAAAYQSESDDPAHLADIIESQRAFAPDPDLIIILDLPVDAALDRLDRLHLRDALETRETLIRARNVYSRLAEIHPHSIIIDASGSPEEVAARVRAAALEG